MRRLDLIMAMVGATMVVSWAAGCDALPGKAEAKSPPPATPSPADPTAATPKGTMRQPGKAADPGHMKPVIFDPFATPFAVVEKDSGTCVLPFDTGAWRIEPPLPSIYGKKTEKAGAKGNGKTAGGAYGPGDGQLAGHAGGKPDGDLFVQLRIVVPRSIDDTSRRLIQEFADHNKQNPRAGLW